MGTTLTGTTPQDTYDSLIKVTDNGPISGTLKALSDGLGNDSVLAISTASTSITAASAAIGLTLANSTGGTKADFTITENVGLAIDFNEGATARSLDLLSAGSSRLFITSAGNVGIGTTAPATKLDVQGTFNVGLFNTNTPTTLQNDNTAATPTLSLFKNTTLTTEEIFRVTSFQGAVTTVASINSGGIVAARGLKFPATQVASADANTLDDYEEGTWTMGVSFGGASVGVTYTLNTGTYTKIGRQVTVNGYLVLSNKGSSTGNARITGLPFTVAGGASHYSAATLYFAVVQFTNQFQGYADVNTTTVILEETTILGVTTALTNADFANNSNIMVTATYYV